VTGLVIEAMRKMVSRRIGALPPMACVPIASTWVSPCRLTSVTGPGSVPRATWSAITSCMRARRARENPPPLILARLRSVGFRDQDEWPALIGDALGNNGIVITPGGCWFWLGGRPARLGSGVLGTMATHRLRIGRVGAHIDATLPLALERVGDAELH